MKERRLAIELLAHSSFEIVGETLRDPLSYRQPQEIQLASIRALAALDHPSVASTLLTRWGGYSPPLRGEATEEMFARAKRLTSFLRAIEKGDVPIVDLDAARRQSLLDHPDATIRERGTELFSEHSTSDRAQVLESCMESLKVRWLDGKRSRRVREDLFVVPPCRQHGTQRRTQINHQPGSHRGITLDPDHRSEPTRAAELPQLHTGHKDGANSLRNHRGRDANERYSTTGAGRRGDRAAKQHCFTDIVRAVAHARRLRERDRPQKMAHLIRFIQSISGSAE